MRVVIDIEGNSLNPTKIWLIVCRDIDTNAYHIFRRVSDDDSEMEAFKRFSLGVTLWIGHNLLGYDLPVLERLGGCVFRGSTDSLSFVDTLIVSKLVDYSRDSGHSIESYGQEFGLNKGKFSDWSKYSPEMEEYCIRDVDITYMVYKKYIRYIKDPIHLNSILLENNFQSIVNTLSTNGFFFNTNKANTLLERVSNELLVLDKDIQSSFLPTTKLVREVTPRETKHGTIARNSIPKILGDDLSCYSADAPFSLFVWVQFNPGSPKQIVETLNRAGWKPEDKTKTHIETEIEWNRLNRSRERSFELDTKKRECYSKLQLLKITGWKVNEHNLNTLPKSAPLPARTLARRILLEARRRTLTEWLGLVHPDTNRIHGSFYGIGAWTHRMAHQRPNTANIPNEFDTAGKLKLYGKEMRSLWCAPKNRLLVGVDAEGIQLRIFAHYIDDKEFTQALVDGKKDDKTDPHSLNQRVLGNVCKSRAAAKRFIYALLLGAGSGKLTEILGCSPSEAQEALDRLLTRYTGFQELKEQVIPGDAARGYFTGLDGRKVRIPGDTAGARRHLAMSGYLQNGEAVVMKKATVKWHDLLKKDNAILVNFVHDEWQTETPNDMEIALNVARMQADSLRIVGEELNLKCPLAGSYWNDDHHDYTIATNWSATH